MQKRVTMKKKIVFMIIAVTLIVTMAAVTAFAEGETGVTILGGTLNGGDMIFTDFAPVMLNGYQQTTDSSWVIADIIDARGTGDGWNLSLTLTQLREYDIAGSAYVVGGKDIPANSVTVNTAPVVNLDDITSSPINTITAVINGTPLDTGTPVKLLSAAVDGGMGSYTIDDMIARLAIRADAYAKTYKADATFAMVTGP